MVRRLGMSKTILCSSVPPLSRMPRCNSAGEGEGGGNTQPGSHMVQELFSFTLSFAWALFSNTSLPS